MSTMDAFFTEAKKIWSGVARQGTVNLRLITIGVLGVLLIVAGSIIEQPQVQSKTDVVPETKSQQPVIVRSYEEALESKLANLLSQVKGAGAVAVSITLESGSTQEHAKNVTRETKVIQEKDTAGGSRTTTETRENEQILVSKENGADRPVMVKETKPLIKGVLVIAEGAYDSTVKANLTRAVEVGIGVPSYKITVLPQRK